MQRLREYRYSVWDKMKGDIFKKLLMLICNSFRAYRTEKVNKLCCEMKSPVALVPGSHTSLLQPLNVCINKLV